jgi:glycosyltransferase involved in cell wall biosynthesis
VTKRPVRVLELRSVRGTGGGPEKTILKGAARTDPSAFAITVCYLRNRHDGAFAIGDDARRLPIDYVEIDEAHALDWSVFTRLRELTRARGIQIVHAHEYKTDLLALMLSRCESIVPLATVHGWTGHTHRERWFYYPADKRLLRRFTHLIAVSSDIRDELVRHGADPGRISVVLNGIDHRVAYRRTERRESMRRELGVAPDELVIGAVGRAEPQKRFDLLLDVFASLVAERPALRLVVAGDGSLRSALESRAEALGVSQACRFLGHRRDVVDLHSAFDLLVQSSYYEGTPNAVLEAMACGTPIVATDVGGTREVARHGLEALIVPPQSHERLRAAIVECLDDPASAFRRAVAARARVETELSFDARMTRVEQVYVELAERQQAVRKALRGWAREPAS